METWATGFNEAAGIPRGRRVEGDLTGRDRRHASMRPRVFPAEDIRSSEQRVGRRRASMRPRVFPAEDINRFGTDGGDILMLQ